MALPSEIEDLTEMAPVEDLLLTLLRQKITTVPIQSLYEDDQTAPMVLVRRSGDWGMWRGDRRFVDMGQVNVQCICSGIDADSDAAILSEAVRVALLQSVNIVVPPLGHLTAVQMLMSPRRTPDWATSSGPVQYADLPTGFMRYETIYEVTARRYLG